MSLVTKDLRNLAIIAHVDHGKTTMIDSILKQSGNFQEHQHMPERIMDQNDLEKERGITILSKCTSIEWDGKKINIIDTPGHADFGGEVERVLSMVDGVLLLVDSSEGVMPQTKFVLSKALSLNLRPIVIINKIDRQDERIQEVVEEITDLFLMLDASAEQLDFPILYASGRNGYAMNSLDDEKKNMEPLMQQIIAFVPPPKVDIEAPFSFLGSILEADSFLGRTLIGKIYSGIAKTSSSIKVLDASGKLVERAKITRLQAFCGIKRQSVDTAVAGDIISISGITKATVTDTICDEALLEPIPSCPIDPPTVSISLGVNTSPLAGQDGNKLTSNMIRERLLKEAEYNVALKVDESAEKDTFEVKGRGELQLGILIETMRREGFELSVSRPRVITQKNDAGELLEPIEEVIIDVDEDYYGVIAEKMTLRKGEMQDMQSSKGGKIRMIFHIPSRGLIGYRNEFLTDTRGTGVLNRIFHGYGPYRGEVKSYRNGVLVSTETGEAIAFALFNLQDRGIMFVSPKDKVYEGMIIGEHNRDNDLSVNPIKGKQLTNIRAAGSDEAVKLTPPRVMTLESMMSYIGDDELIEVTPKCLRMRKRYLNSNERKRAERGKITG